MICERGRWAVGMLVLVVLFAAVPAVVEAAEDALNERNPHAEALREARATLEKAHKDLLAVLQSGNLDIGKLIAALQTYIRAREELDRVQKLYDEWETNNPPKPKRETKRVRITAGHPNMEGALGTVFATEKYGTRSATSYLVQKNVGRVKPYMGKDVMLTGYYTKIEGPVGGFNTVDVIRVRPLSNDRRRTKKVTIRRVGRSNRVFGDDGTNETDEETVEETQNLGQIALDQARRQLAVSLYVGQRFRFGLETNPSTGYSWSWFFAPPGIAQVAHQWVEEPPAIDGPNGITGMVVGAPTTKWWSVVGQKAGRCVLYLDYRRQWEDDVRANRRVAISITVKDGPVPPPPQTFVYFADAADGTWRVTDETAKVVARYAGRRVALTGYYREITAVRQGGEDDVAESGASEDVRVFRHIRGDVQALRARPLDDDDEERKWVRITGITLMCYPPITHYYCTEDTPAMQRRYRVTSGQKLLEGLAGSWARVTGLWQFPEVANRLSQPTGTVRVTAVQTPRIMEADETQPQGDDLDNPFE